MACDIAIIGALSCVIGLLVVLLLVTTIAFVVALVKQRRRFKLELKKSKSYTLCVA